MIKEKLIYVCDFCGKSQDDVEKMIAGPRPSVICNECVAACVELLSGKTDISKTENAGGDKE